MHLVVRDVKVKRVGGWVGGLGGLGWLGWVGVGLVDMVGWVWWENKRHSFRQ